MSAAWISGVTSTNETVARATRPPLSALRPGASGRFASIFFLDFFRGLVVVVAPPAPVVDGVPATVVVVVDGTDFCHEVRSKVSSIALMTLSAIMSPPARVKWRPSGVRTCTPPMPR